jgi:hypothetical protein
MWLLKRSDLTGVEQFRLLTVYKEELLLTRMAHLQDFSELDHAEQSERFKFIEVTIRGCSIGIAQDE